MDALPFLKKYRGETVEELIAMEGRYRTDSIVLTIHDLLLDKQRLSKAESTVLIVEAVEREVNNGGFHQFFLNAPQHVADVVDALHRIGCVETAALAQEAIVALRLEGQPSEEAIQATIHEDDEKRDAALDRCDEAYYKSPDGQIEDKLFAYIKANRSDIHLDSAMRR